MLVGRIHIIRTLLVIASLIPVGIYGYYQACQWIARWAFTHQSYFAADELILVKIPQTDLSPQNDFLRSDGEFEWQGEMVDVLHREFRSDTLYIYGFRDKVETKLKQEAAWLYPDRAHPDHSPLSSYPKRSKWLSLFALLPSSTMAWLAAYSPPLQTPFFADFPSRIRLPLLEVLDPPPNW